MAAKTNPCPATQSLEGDDAAAAANAAPLPRGPHTDPRYTALLEGSLSLSRHGEWWHEGKPFTNPQVAGLFHRSICWDNDYRRYVVRLGAQQALFSCEDTAFFVEALLTSPEGPRLFRVLLNDSRIVALDPATLCTGTEGQFYCLIPRESSSASPHVYARFRRAAHQVLLQHADDAGGLCIGGVSIAPCSAPPGPLWINAVPQHSTAARGR